MRGWLLDANIMWDLRRLKPAPAVIAFVAGQNLDRLYVSAVTLAEIRFGIEGVAEAARRAELQDWLAHHVRPRFENRILPVSEDVMFNRRLLVEEGRKARHTFSQPGSDHRRHGAPTWADACHSRPGDFERARVPVLNPWLAAKH